VCYLAFLTKQEYKQDKNKVQLSVKKILYNAKHAIKSLEFNG